LEQNFKDNIMKKELTLFQVILLCLGISLFSTANAVAQNYTVSTYPTLSPNNGSGGIAFNVGAVQEINILEIHNTFYSGSIGYTIWYNTDSINGNPTISTANGWVVHQTGTVTGNNTTPVTVTLTNALNIPAGETYGIFIEASGNTRYQTGTTGPWLFTDGNMYINTGPQVGYGGPAPNPSNHPRQFVGRIVYELAVLPPGLDVEMASIDSPLTFGVGNNDLVVTIKNNYADSVLEMDLGYQINNSTPVLVFSHKVQKSGQDDTLWARESYQYKFPTPVNLPAKGSYTLQVWVNNPNGTFPDDVSSNDTIVMSICTGMSGTYTIGPSTTDDYANVTAAINALKQCGVAGPVVFELAKGTYTERVELEEITGMSQINTVTFDGKDKDDVTIQYSAASSASRATILFDEADYFVFKNLTIKGLSSSYATALHFMNEANYNKIIDCNLEVPVSSSSNINVVLASASESSYSSTGDNGFFNTIDNCEIKGGYYGIRWNGQGSSTSAKTNYDNHFLNSTFTDQNYYLYYAYYCGGHNVSYNIMNQPTNVEGYSIYNYYGAEDTFTSNYIEPGRYGIYQYYYNSRYNNGSSLIANNIIMNFKNTTYQTGISCYNYCYKQFIYNNTIWVNGSTGNNRDYSALYMYYPYDSEVKNNIFISTGGTMLTSYYYPRGNWDVDYNQYDYNNMTGTYAFYGYPYASSSANTDYHTNFNSWLDFDDPVYMGVHDANSWDNGSINFVSSTDLHLDSQYPALMGDEVGLSDDIDGDPRCKYETAIGADETEYSTGTPTSMFVSDDTLCFGTPVIFANTASKDAKQGYFWYRNGQKVSEDHTWQFTFPSGTYSDTISLVTENCDGIDSFAKIVYVDTPIAPPVADFISDLNQVEVSLPVQFYDISQNCPDSWYWIINPATVFNPSLGTTIPSATFVPPSTNASQNPYISFDYPGSYDVCLVTTNIRGADTICKQDYILVKPTQWMCQYVLPSVSKSLFGYLYDDGGPFSDYANNVNCSILLDPCASQLGIEFTEFDFASGDYLRLYDGTDNTGTPMWDVNAYGNLGLTGDMTNSAFDTIFYSQSGKIYIELQTNASGQAPGFQAEWFGVKGNYNAPVANFIVDDTVCYNQEINFLDNSTGDELSYAWDFDASGFVESTDQNPTWTYNLYGPGVYTVELIIENCGGVSSKKKNIMVIQPNSAPNPDFEADVLNPEAGQDHVSFTELSYANSANPFACRDAWEWQVSPDSFINSFGIKVPSFEFVGGTSANSQNPVIKFIDTGYYDVKLIVYYNNIGAQIIKSDYIHAIKYCEPAVANLNPDVGISRVVLNDIDNKSIIGARAYTNYSNDVSTYLDLQDNYTLTLERNSTFNEMSRAVWIDWDIDGVFEASELIGKETNAKTLTWSKTFTVPANATVGATRMRVATNLGILNNTDPCDARLYGEIEDYRIIVRPDGTGPMVDPIGPDTITLDQCACNSYFDSGAIAIDNISGVVPVTTTNNLDCSTIGEYYYRYSAVDGNGNKTVKDRVIYVTSDSEPPTLTLLGNTIDTIEVYSNWTDLGYIADDTCSGLDRVDVVGQVDTSKLGTYVISYTAYDKSLNKNSITKTRTIVVVDRTLPTINLNGFSVMNVEIYKDFVDPGVTYNDNYCSNTDLEYEVSGNVNTDKFGTYTITYSVTDCNGNGPVSVQRTVIVSDTTKPEIISPVYRNGDTIAMDVFTVLEIPNIQIEDNFDQSPKISYTGTFTTSFSNFYADQIGLYTLSLTAEDGSGNQSIINWVIIVEDNEAPEIELTGKYVVNLCRWDTLEDYRDYVVTDNYYNGIEPVISGSYINDYLRNYNLGFYTISYDATDGSGNKAKRVVRYISIKDCPSGIDEVNLAESVNIYPNPTTGRFTIDIEFAETMDAEILIINTLGKTIKNIELENIKSEQYFVDLSNFSNGVYLVKIQTENSSIVKRITLTN
jgi:PKD repeat protein